MTGGRLAEYRNGGVELILGVEMLGQVPRPLGDGLKPLESGAARGTRNATSLVQCMPPPQGDAEGVAQGACLSDPEAAMSQQSGSTPAE